MFFELIHALGGPGIGHMVITAEDHVLVCVTQPEHGLVHIDTGITKHGAIAVPQIVRTEGNGMTGSFRKGFQIAFPAALEGLQGGGGIVIARIDKAL